MARRLKITCSAFLPRGPSRSCDLIRPQLDLQATGALLSSLTNSGSASISSITGDDSRILSAFYLATFPLGAITVTVGGSGPGLTLEYDGLRRFHSSVRHYLLPLKSSFRLRHFALFRNISPVYILTIKFTLHSSHALPAGAHKKRSLTYFGHLFSLLTSSHFRRHSKLKCLLPTSGGT